MSLPMKWMDLGVCATRHQSSKLLAVLRRTTRAVERHVADRRVEPHVPVVAGRVGDLEAEVRRGPRDVPVAQRLGQEMALQVVGDLRLQVVAGSASTRSRNACSCSISTNRCGALRSSGVAPDSVLTGSISSVGAVGAAALLAVVAVLVGRAALRAGALDEAIGQEHAGLRDRRAASPRAR